LLTAEVDRYDVVPWEQLIAWAPARWGSRSQRVPSLFGCAVEGKRGMGIKVEVDQVILSGEPFDVTLAVDDGEHPGTFDMTLEINGASRSFGLGLSPTSARAGRQVVEVEHESIWTVQDWGTAAPGSLLEVKLEEQAGENARLGSDRAAIMPSS